MVAWREMERMTLGESTPNLRQVLTMEARTFLMVDADTLFFMVSFFFLVMGYVTCLLAEISLAVPTSELCQVGADDGAYRADGDI